MNRTKNHRTNPEIVTKAAGIFAKVFGNGLTKHDAQVELIFYKMKLAELDYRKRRGELLEATVARHEWSRVIMLIVSRLEGLPSKVGPLL
jgi:phage terminase Nu1 subunit (DNA packaging protein)